jgi:hypothetical protein
LWPPTASEPRHRIYVSLDTWHGMIGYQVEGEADRPEHVEGRPPAVSHQHSLLSLHPSLITHHPSLFYEEWGYAERSWYVEDRQGAAGFWPTAGTVEVGRHEELWAARTPNPPADLFVFELSDEGFARLRRHLQATIAEAEIIARAGGSRFYPSVRSYHAFHHCHHYVARALREAGLPVSSLGALTRTTLAWQLRRAEWRERKAFTGQRSLVDRVGYSSLLTGDR